MKLDRMIGILSILLRQDLVTAPELAERFEVSRRTIQRDMEALCRAGIPIAARQGTRGGFSVMEGYRVDRSLLTGGEMRSILAGLRSLDSVSGTRQYARLMEKLSAGAIQPLQGDDCVLIDLASWYKGPLSEMLQEIRAAIDEARTIEFCYHAPSGDSARTVEPCYLVYQWASWYVYGWCRQRGEWRLFKLNRMTRLRMGEAFERRETPYPDLTTERVFPERYHVRMRVEACHKWRLIEEYGPDCYARQPDGSLLFEAGFTNKNHLMSWLLSFGDGAELLEPEEMRAELLRIIEATRQKYSKEGRRDADALRMDGRLSDGQAVGDQGPAAGMELDSVQGRGQDVRGDSAGR